MSMNQEAKAIQRTFYVVFWLLFAALLATIVASTTHIGSGGRDFRPLGFVLSLILLSSGMAFRYIARWSWSSLVSGLAIVEVLALLVIGYFSGSDGADLFSQFNLRWLAAVNVFLGLPWFCGVGLGEALLHFTASRGRG